MYSSLKYYFRQFANFTEEEWLIVERKIVPIHIEKGGYLLKKGQVCNSVSFIEKGIVRIYYIEKKKEFTTDFASEGSFISDYASFLTQQPATFNIQACEDCVFFTLPYQDLQTLYKLSILYSEVGRKIAEALFLRSVQKNTSMLSKSPEERYRELTRVNHGFIQRIPQFLIASYLGITPEHLSRIRKKAIKK